MSQRWKMLLPMLALTVLGTTGAMGQGARVATVTFTVLKDASGKPIRNASVILHPVDKKGKQKRGGQQLKTDEEGKCQYPGVPYGKMRVQVIAPSYQTFGEDYDIATPEMEIVIRLRLPQEQHTIYDKPKN
jgi:5-hydroxyisourate hydrolase-like protein (transthyretin family)